MDVCMVDKNALANLPECGKSHVLSLSPSPTHFRGPMKSLGFDALGFLMELGTILRISFFECRSPAVDLWFIFLHRVAGTLPAGFHMGSVPVPALGRGGGRQGKYRVTYVSSRARSSRMANINYGWSFYSPIPFNCPESYALPSPLQQQKAKYAKKMIHVTRKIYASPI